MKPIPHRHPGEVELCWDKLCARVTTDERSAAILGGGVLGAIVGGWLTRNAGGALGGAVVGALLGAWSTSEERPRPT